MLYFNKSGRAMLLQGEPQDAAVNAI